jgi:fucose permease
MIQLVALLCVFGLGSCFALLGSISVKLMPRLQIDQGKFGALVSALMLACLTASAIVGIVIDVVGYKPVAVVGFVIAGLCTFAIARSRSYAAVLVSCVLLGFGAIALNTAGNTLLPAVLFGGKNQAAALNLGNVCFGLGVLLTPLIVSFLFQKLSYEKAVSVVALILLAPFPLALLATYPAGEPGFVVTDAFALLREPAVVVAALMMFCYISLETSFCNWLPVFGKEVIGRSRADAGVAAVDASAQRLLSLFAVAMMVGRLTASQLPGITTHACWYIAAASVVATATLVLMSVAKSAGQARVAAILGGLSLAPIFPTIAGSTLARFSPKVHGSIIGIIFLMGFVGASIAPRVIGSLAKGSSVQRSLRLLVPLAALLVILAMAAAAIP